MISKNNQILILFLLSNSIIVTLVGTLYKFSSFFFQAYSYIFILVFLYIVFIVIKEISITRKYLPICIIYLILLIGSFALPYHWDDTFYNAYFLKEYLAENQFTYLSKYGYYSAFPIYGYSLNIIFFSLFNYYGAGLVSLTFLLLFLIGINNFFINLKIDTDLKIIGLLLFISSPALIEYGGTSKEDIIVNYLVFLSFYILLLNSKLFNINSFYSSVILISFAVGFKYTALNYAPIFYVLFLYKILSKNQPKQRIIEIHIYAFLIFFLVNFPWLFRNYQEIGNPLYPLFSGLMPFNEKFIFSDLSKIYLNEQINGLIQNKFHDFSGFYNFFKFINKSVYAVTFLFPLILIIIPFRKLSKIEKEIIIISCLLILYVIFFLNWEMRHFLLIYFFTITSGLILLNKIKIINDFYFILKKIILLSVVIYLTVNGIEYVGKKYGKQFLCTINDEPVKCLLSKNQYLRTVNYIDNNIDVNKKIATNALPFFYLKNDFLYIQPWADYQNLDLDNPENVLIFIKENNAEYLSWSFFNQFEAYHEIKGAHLREYFFKMNYNINYLETNKHLTPVYEDKKTKLYKIN